MKAWTCWSIEIKTGIPGFPRNTGQFQMARGWYKFTQLGVPSDSFPHSADHIWALVSTPGLYGTCNRCKTKKKIPVKLTPAYQTGFSLRFCHAKQFETKWKSHSASNGQRIFFICRLFWIFYLARHLFYLFKFGSLSSICGCNKLLLIEAQAGRQNKKIKKKTDGY